LVIIEYVDVVTAYIGLGANLGESEQRLLEAVERLDKEGVEILRLSTLYRSEPVEAPPQPWFVNAVVSVRCAAGLDSALDLLRICQSIERAAGRERTIPKGPRTLDLDLLLCGDLMVETDALVVPHPGLGHRRFVLVPLVEIAPEVVDPRSGLTTRELLARCADQGAVQPWRQPSAARSH
jgi:2-amino-4-hydroxy-6-hydroxymethyldihydropteridine diphosphokinase